MFSPKLLINLSVFLAFVAAALFVLMLWLPPYTGFEIEFDESAGHFVVTRTDDWVVDQGLNVGDGILAISAAGHERLVLNAGHYPASTMEARNFHDTKQAQVRAMARVHDILAAPLITLSLASGQALELTLDHKRPLTSIGFEVWMCVFLTVMSSFLPALAWAWRPAARETLYLLFSGIGLSLATISAAVLYTMEMYYLPLWGHWLVFELIGFGNFLFVGFATVLLLYFPRKLKNADRWNRILLGGLLAFTLVTFFDGWDFSAPVVGQYLDFAYGEVYFVEVFLFCIILFLCFVQWRESHNKPVERAQALWVILAWTLCPAIFFVFYLLPVLAGQEAILSRTWTTTALLGAFAMVIAGVGRLRFFRLENHIGAAYQWTFVSLFFFSLDIMLVSLANIGPATSSVILLGMVLWVYLPIRQWFFSRVSQDRQHRYQALFNQAVTSMIEDSLIPTRPSSTDHGDAWHKTLNRVFAPGEINAAPPGSTSHVAKRGQQLIVAANRFSDPLSLEFAEGGARVFNKDDVNLVETLSLLFVRLHDFRDGYAEGQIRERDRIRRDLHDQIGHKLLSLVYTAQDTKSLQLAQDTMDQLRELIRAMKDEPVSLQNLVAELRQLCEDTCEQVNLSLHWHDSSEDEGQFITSNQYLNILNIVRELLSNTARHARASNATISVEQADGQLVLSVADNGVGFDQTTITPGNGLFNIQSRAEEMASKIDWQTIGGTRVVISIPLRSVEDSKVA